ncbi:MAG TPA: YsnF/AvaK domain-containing protein [Rhodopila sp.]|nr:YsnF/AvaK domain-containing protein [Rhodopila sp.]
MIVLLAAGSGDIPTGHGVQSHELGAEASRNNFGPGSPFRRKAPGSAMSDTPDDADVTIPLAEERLTVGKRQVETGRVRVRVVTDSDTVNAKASLFDQAVDVKRVPIGREVTEVPQVRQEGDLTVIPVLEEVLVVEKRLVLVEEVHVRRVVTQTDMEHPVTVRRQRAEIVRTRATPDDPIKE